ncbi:hypothetical protein L3Q82_017843 [Scortum barcoo]|uniref:Uncharacterized protein n=1 Tax=Scortum barcoo TaxID=214431 RepID=A0ACB8VKH0_9TELE|nr:hypothetical protein L3Q82_017843 [Scortum barcoo]
METTSITTITTSTSDTSTAPCPPSCLTQSLCALGEDSVIQDLIEEEPGSNKPSPSTRSEPPILRLTPIGFRVPPRNSILTPQILRRNDQDATAPQRITSRPATEPPEDNHSYNHSHHNHNTTTDVMKDITSDTVVSSTGAPRAQCWPLLSSPCTPQTFATTQLELCHIQKYAGDCGVNFQKSYVSRDCGSFNICSKLLRMFYQSVVASVLFYTVVCWGAAYPKKDTSRLDKLIRRAGSVVGMNCWTLW